MDFTISWNLAAAPPRPVEGGYALPAEFTARWEFPDDHAVEFDVAVEGDAPVCNAIRVERATDGPSLSGTELRRIPIREWLEFACSQAALRVEHSGAGVSITPFPEGEGPDPLRRRRRTTLTPEILTEVARVYRANEEHGAPTAAVRDAWHLSPRTASRWVAAAKKEHPEMFDQGDESTEGGAR